MQKKTPHILKLPSYRAKDVIEEILTSQELEKFLQIYAKNEADQQNLIAQARNILWKLSAQFSPAFVQKAYWTMQKVSKKMFSTLYFKPSELAQTADYVKNHSVVFLPTHKSHMDYMLLSSVLYQNQISPPHIAAGMNLCFWPVGNFMRKSGAFFIQRSLNRDRLYVKVLDLYLDWLVRQQYTQELFIEGGRSRDGKIRAPSLGILHLLIEAQKAHHSLCFIPVQISYDQVPDQPSLTREQMGKQKQEENIFQVFEAFTLLKNNYGNVYLQFGRRIESHASHPKDQAKDIASQACTYFRKHQHPTGRSILSRVLHRGDLHKQDLLSQINSLANKLQDQNTFELDLCLEAKMQYQRMLDKNTLKWEDSKWSIEPEEIPAIEYYSNSLELI